MSKILPNSPNTNTPLASNVAVEPLFATDHRIYINHTDAGGIVYHGNHLVFFENCRRDWFTKLGLNTYFLQSDNGPAQHFVISQANLQYQKAILLDETINVRIDKVELKPASIVFYQSIHRHLPKNMTASTATPKLSETLLSSAKIIIACVQNQTNTETNNRATTSATFPSAAPIRLIRIPKKLYDSIQHAIVQQQDKS